MINISRDSQRALNDLARNIYTAQQNAGWWDNLDQIPAIYVKSTKIALMHSELSEALEGARKELQDKHLPEYPNEHVEMADTIIRILDYCGRYKIPIGEIVAAKTRYNQERADHKKENRDKPGGKQI